MRILKKVAVAAMKLKAFLAEAIIVILEVEMQQRLSSKASENKCYKPKGGKAEKAEADRIAKEKAEKAAAEKEAAEKEANCGRAEAPTFVWRHAAAPVWGGARQHAARARVGNCAEESAASGLHPREQIGALLDGEEQLAVVERNADVEHLAKARKGRAQARRVVGGRLQASVIALRLLTSRNLGQAAGAGFGPRSSKLLTGGRRYVAMNPH